MSDATQPTSRQRSLAAVGLGVALAALAVLLSVNPTPANDLFWHIRTGRMIVGSLQVPHADPFSWTCYGKPWVAGEWLSFVLFYIAFVNGGFGAVWLLVATLLVGVSLLLYGILLRRTGGSIAGAFALTVLALLAFGRFLQPRPQLFTYLVLPLVWNIVLSAHERTERRAIGDGPGDGRASWDRSVLWLPPIFVLWANLHQGVLSGVALLWAAVAGEIVSWLLRRRRPDTAGLAAASGKNLAWMAPVALACTAATLVTPFGVALYTETARFVSDPKAIAPVGEWTPFRWLGDADSAAFLTLVVLTVGGFAVTRRPRQPMEIAVVAGLALEAFLHWRHVPLFALCAVLTIAPHLASVVERLGAAVRPLPPAFRAGAGALAVAAAAGAVLWARAPALGFLSTTIFSSPQWLERIGQRDVALATYPEAACAFLEREAFPTPLRLYNDYDIGGYLIGRLPRYPVFIDSRETPYLGTVLDDYYDLEHGNDIARKRAILRKYALDCVFTRERNMAALFFNDPEWALVYRDPETARPLAPVTWILLRRKPEYAELIERSRRDCPEAAQVQSLTIQGAPADNAGTSALSPE